MTHSNIGRVFQISMSNGGLPKQGVPEATISINGMGGDDAGDDGPERAVRLYSLEKIQLLQEEGHPIFPGAIGENLTLLGIDWTEIVPDAVLNIGAEDGPRLQIVGAASPSTAMSAYFKDGAFERIDEERRSGWGHWYACVLREGPVHVGDSARIE